MAESNSESESHSAVSDSELYSPRNSPGQNTGVGSCSLLQENVPTQVSHIAGGDSLPAEPQKKPKTKSKEGLNSLLMKVKEESQLAGLKLNTQKTKIMASGPITTWEIDGETLETVSNFIFWGSKITADGDCSHEIKKHLLLGRKAMTNLDSILKSRDITLPTKVHLVKATLFPVDKYGCESWTIKLSAEELMLLNSGVGEDY